MEHFRRALLLTVCWQLCHSSVWAQSSRANARSLFSELRTIDPLRFQQDELQLGVDGLLGFRRLTTIDVPATSAFYGFVSTISDTDSPATATMPNTATAAFEQLERTHQDDKGHPLKPWIQYATSRYDYARQNVRDHTCVLIKRERIGGVLTDYQYLVAKSRCQQQRGPRTVVPLSIFLHYFGPTKLKGRKVIYVAGQNDNKMLVRKGGRRLGFVRVKIDPSSDAALRASRYPITELGIDNVIKRLLQRAQQDVESDPDGVNTTVEFFRGAKINKRSCVRVRVTHPQRQDGLSFHRAEIYIDDLLQVPIRIEAYDWPKDAEEDPPLLEEFTYTNLKLNVGLKAADFLPRLLD